MPGRSLAEGVYSDKLWLALLAFTLALLWLLGKKTGMALKKKLFTPAQLTELEELKQNLVHPRHRATSAKPLAEAQEPPNAVSLINAVNPS